MPLSSSSAAFILFMRSYLRTCCSTCARVSVASLRTTDLPSAWRVQVIRDSLAVAGRASQAANSATAIKGQTAERRAAVRGFGVSAFFGPLLLAQQSLFGCCLPKGDLRIAHPFKGGIDEEEHRVPKGRPNLNDENGIGNGRIKFGRFSRPFGTWAMSRLHPAVNCRAIFKSPSGREKAPFRTSQPAELPAPVRRGLNALPPSRFLVFSSS